MGAMGVTDRTIVSADELFDVARSIADESADPVATYESFLRGLEIGLAYNTLDPVLSKAIGNKLADRLPAKRQTYEYDRANVQCSTDLDKKRRLTAMHALVASGADFPTEWTLDS